MAKRDSKRWAMTEADAVAMHALTKRARQLSDKESPEVEAVRGQIRAALLSTDRRGNDHLGRLAHQITLATIAKDGVDPESAVEFLAYAAETFATLVAVLRKAA